MSELGKEIFVFGDFRVDRLERTITFGAELIRTTPKVFDLLVHFLRNPGRLVTKQELLDAVWPDVEVEEGAIARAVCDLRHALGQYDKNVLIETVAKFGYRFVAPVEVAKPVLVTADVGADAVLRAPITRRRQTLVVAAALLPAVAGLSLWMRSGAEAPVRSIAVLPFQVVGEVEDASVFAVGLADAVATRLAGMRGLIVKPTAATRKYAEATVDFRRVARDLQVDAVLDGTLQVLNGRARVTARLTRADGIALWSAEIESDALHAFALEREVAQRVAMHVMSGGVKPQRLLADDTEQDAIREHYFKGRGFWMRRDRAGLDRAIKEFQAAIALNPRFAPAHAGLADCYLLLGLYNHLPPSDMLPRARAEAEEAVKLDSELASAHATLGLITQNWERDWAATERHYQRSIEAAPDYSTAHHWYAEFLSVLGRFSEAEAHFREAERIDPASSIIRTDEAQLWYFAREYERSRAVLSQVLELDPDFEQAHEQMALVYAAQGDEAKAWEEASRLRECREPDSICRLRWTAWLPGRDARAARAALERLLRESAERYVPPRALAIAYARQGKREQAVQWLSKAVRTREVGAITIKVDPLLDPVRSEPGFIKLLRELRLV